VAIETACTWHHLEVRWKKIQTLAVAQIWLEYGSNGVLVGLTVYVRHRVQSVLNEAAQLTFNLRRFSHISNALISLNWLPVAEQIQYQIAVLTDKVLHGTAPQYLGPVAGAKGAGHTGRRLLGVANGRKL